MMTMPSGARSNDGTDDAAIDLKIGTLLRTGVLLSAVVVALGGVLFLLQQGGTAENYTGFHGVPTGLSTLSGIVSGAAQGSALAIIQLGLLVLIATPIARVVFSVYVFLTQRDYLYVIISVIVLAVLLCSLIWH